MCSTNTPPGWRITDNQMAQRTSNALRSRPTPVIPSKVADRKTEEEPSVVVFEATVSDASNLRRILLDAVACCQQKFRLISQTFSDSRALQSS